MQIVQKLFFIICIVFTSATFGMIKNKQKRSPFEATFFENFYSMPIKKVDPVKLFENTNMFKNKNVNIISSFFPYATCTSSDCKEYGTKIKKAFSEIYFYRLYTKNGEFGEGDFDISPLESVILEQHELSSEKGMHKLPRNINETEIIIEDPEHIKQLKAARYKKIYPGKTIQKIITRRMYNTNNRKSLDRMLVYGKNMSTQESIEFKDRLLALLSLNYDEIFFDDGSSKIAFITDLEENASNIQIPSNSATIANQNQPVAKPNSNKNQPTIVQRPPLWKDERVYTSLAIGVAGTLGLLKLYNWFRPTQP